MGDPATEIWTGVPRILDVDCPDQISTSANAVPITVHSDGLPVANARVALVQLGTLRSVGHTDSQGRVVLDVSSASEGDVQVTIMGHNLYPHQGSMAVGTVDRSLEALSHVIEGGVLQPGQSTALSLELGNSGQNSAPAVSALVGGNQIWWQADASPVDFGTVPAGEAAWGQDDFVLHLDDHAPGGEMLTLEVVAASGAEQWSSLLNIPVTGPRVSASAPQWDVPGGSPDPGEGGAMSLTIQNIGNLGSAGATGVLSCDSHWIDVVSDAGTWGSISIGGSASQQLDFEVASSALCMPGHLANFTLELTFSEGGRQDVEFQVVIGQPDEGDPAGPDPHGYYAFDNEDDSPLAPTYQWVDLQFQGGVDLGISDNGRYQDETKVVDLPFEFTYYGQVYDKISVCSNGWISFGATDLKFYRNWYLPAAGTPDAMVAAFWLDLAMGSVLAKHDTVNHRYILQWNQFQTFYSEYSYSGNNTFQIILLDPAHHATDTGDGIIEMQYNALTIYNQETNLFTTGIQNADRTQGLTYAYAGSYAGGAASIEPGRAISWRTVRPTAQGQLEGQITAAPTTGPVSEARIGLVGSHVSLVSDADGQFSGSVPVGLWDVAFDHPGCAPDTVRGVLISEGQTTTLNRELVDNAGPWFTNLELPVSTEDTTGPYLVRSTMSDVSGFDQAQLIYTSSTQGGPHQLEMTPVTGQPGTYQAQIPGQPMGTLVQYWMVAEDALGQVSQSPQNAPWPLHRFQINQVGVLVNEDFETLGNWQVNAQGQDSASAGLWAWGDPLGTSYNGNPVQPENDHTDAPGTNCWFTGQHQSGQNAGYNDVDNGATTLTSPIWDMTGSANVTISYWRWYTNNAGSSPDQDSWLVELSNDGGNQWAVLENTTSSQASWQQVSVDLSDHFSTPGLVQLRFTASDEGGGSLVEAALDDVLIQATIGAEDSELPTVNLLTPNGGETVEFGQAMAVSWQASDDTGIVQARLSLSLDGGDTFGESLLTGPFNGSCEWTVLAPAGLSQQARLRLEVLDSSLGLATDISDGNFQIVAGQSSVPTPSLLMALGQNHPNPFNPQTEILFSLPRSMETSLRIYDLQGRLVRTLVQGHHAAGPHRVVWKGRDNDGGAVASGTYFYRLTTGEGSLVRKMTLVK